MTPLLIDTAAVSKMTGIAPETLRQWRRLGRGPASRKIGRHWVYRPDDVRAWVDAQFDDQPGECPDCEQARADWRAGGTPVRHCPTCGRDPFEDVVFSAPLGA